MIQIKRTSCPRALVTGKSSTRYRGKSVVRALHKMQNGKCCYCELKLPEVGHLKAVEHFAPQAIFEGRANDWDNLLLACAQCNGNKSDDYPAILSFAEDVETVVYLTKKDRTPLRPLLVNPADVETDPEYFVGFVVSDEVNALVGAPVALDEEGKGKFTIVVTGIDGEYYTGKRRFYYWKLLLPSYAAMCHYADIREQRLLDQEKRSFEGLMSSKSEFAGFARSFARRKKLDQLFGLIIPTGAG